MQQQVSINTIILICLLIVFRDMITVVRIVRNDSQNEQIYNLAKENKRVKKSKISIYYKPVTSFLIDENI